MDERRDGPIRLLEPLASASHPMRPRHSLEGLVHSARVHILREMTPRVREKGEGWERRERDRWVE